MHETRSLSQPDETRRFEHGRMEVVAIAGGTVGKGTFEPGWQWSKHVKPIAKTEWCEAPHFHYQLSGRLAIQPRDGSAFEIGPGDVAVIPPGHDAWVVGNEPVIVVDWSGATNYAKQA